MNPLFCMIYIDTDENLDHLISQVDVLRREIPGGRDVEILLYRNEDFNEVARNRQPYSFIECSRYYGEVAPALEDSTDVDEYQSCVASIVCRLREGRFVTASCDFEDVVAEQTGWNWSRDNPEPPGRGDR